MPCISEPDCLLADIDHAERCLVSAMYQEAAEAATSVLRTLSKAVQDEVGTVPTSQSGPLTDGDASIEYVAMIEAAGMVLLQALNEMGRSCDIFDELKSVFDSMVKVPYSLILTGTCLQLCEGAHPASHIPEYLSGWRSESIGGDLMVATMLHDQQASDNCSRDIIDRRGASCQLYLPKTDYLQLSEIYVIEVLAKVQKDSAAAFVWIKNSNLSEEDKQVILEKLQQLLKRQQTAINCSTEQSSTEKLHMKSSCSDSDALQQRMEETSNAHASEREGMTSSGDWGASSIPPSEAAKQGALVKESSKCWKLPFVKTVLSLLELFMIRLGVHSSLKWTSIFDRFFRGKVLVAGAITVIFVYSLHRKKQYLKRLLLDAGNTVRVCLGDLWQLAFSVHLNPLAAVQPLPSHG